MWSRTRYVGASRRLRSQLTRSVRRHFVMPKGSRLFRSIAGIALIWLLLAGMALLTAWPSMPSSRAGWLLVLVIGPPLYLAGELLAERIWSSKPARAISEHPSRTFRMVTRVLVGVVFLVFVVVLAHL